MEWGKNSLRKATYLLLFIGVIFIGYSLFYFNQYHIDDDKIAVQSSLTEWMSGDSENTTFDVKEIIRLDNTNSHIALFQTENGHVGYAHLIEGWNGKLKIVSSGGHGTNIVSYKVIETDKGNYGILFGKNPELTIDHIKADLNYENYSFSVDLPSDEIFVKYVHLPEDIENPFPAELTYFDKDQSVIELADLFLAENN